MRIVGTPHNPSSFAWTILEDFKEETPKNTEQNHNIQTWTTRHLQPIAYYSCVKQDLRWAGFLTRQLSGAEEWVTAAFGPFWGFQEGFLSWVSSVPWRKSATLAFDAIAEISSHSQRFLIALNSWRDFLETDLWIWNHLLCFLLDSETKETKIRWKRETPRRGWTSWRGRRCGALPGALQTVPGATLAERNVWADLGASLCSACDVSWSSKSDEGWENWWVMVNLSRWLL